MRLELSYPPSINHYWCVSRTGGRYISPDGIAFRERTILAVRQKGIRKLTGSVKLKISAYPPDNRRRDLDNILKSILDALEHADCYANDSQVDDLHIMRGEVIDGGAVVVEIEECQ